MLRFYNVSSKRKKIEIFMQFTFVPIYVFSRNKALYINHCNRSYVRSYQKITIVIGTNKMLKIICYCYLILLKPQNKRIYAFWTIWETRRNCLCFFMFNFTYWIMVKIILVSRKNFWTYFKQKETMIDYISLSNQRISLNIFWLRDLPILTL